MNCASEVVKRETKTKDLENSILAQEKVAQASNVAPGSWDTTVLYAFVLDVEAAVELQRLPAVSIAPGPQLRKHVRRQNQAKGLRSINADIF